MTLEDPTFINAWTEDDLLELPAFETDEYEYKSSRIREGAQYHTELKQKLCKAASAFWNTGGGILVVGVDDVGMVDGGIPDRIGRQKLRDWVSQSLNGVVPTGPYTIQIIRPTRPDTLIEPECVVLVVAFGESFDVPHMAPDHRYYVRAGGHSNPANHYLVEAIRARRGLRRPMLRGLLRENPQKPDVIELVILAVNNIPALNVAITLEPLPLLFANGLAQHFPLEVPVVDASNPFRMDMIPVHERQIGLGDVPIRLHLRYYGLLGREYHETQLLDPFASLGPTPVKASPAPSQGTLNESALKQLEAQLARLNHLLEHYLKVETDV